MDSRDRRTDLVDRVLDVPESLGPDDHCYDTVTGQGQRVSVEFVMADDASLLLQRWRPYKQSRGESVSGFDPNS